MSNKICAQAVIAFRDLQFSKKEAQFFPFIEDPFMVVSLDWQLAICQDIVQEEPDRWSGKFRFKMDVLPDLASFIFEGTFNINIKVHYGTVMPDDITRFYQSEQIQKKMRIHLFMNCYALCLRLVDEKEAECPLAPLEFVVQNEIFRGVL